VAFQTFVVIALGAAALGALSLSPQALRVFYDCLCGALLLMALSIVITLALLLRGETPSSLEWMRFDYGYTGQTGAVLAPLTFGYNNLQLEGRTIVRLCGWMREPGIVPPFLCWAAAWAAHRRWHWSLVLLGLAGSVASLSSLGLILAVPTLGGIILYRIKAKAWHYCVGGVIAALAAWAAYYAPYIGLGAKTESGSVSAVERSYLADEALRVDNWLIGDGLIVYRNETVSMLSSVASSGWILFAVCLAVLLVPALRAPRFFLAAMLPGVVTVVASQPIVLNPLFVALFAAWAALGPAPEAPAAAGKASQRRDWRMRQFVHSSPHGAREHHSPNKPGVRRRRL